MQISQLHTLNICLTAILKPIFEVFKPSTELKRRNFVIEAFPGWTLTKLI